MYASPQEHCFIALKLLLTAMFRAKSPWRCLPWFPITSISSHALEYLDGDLILAFTFQARSCGIAKHVSKALGQSCQILQERGVVCTSNGCLWGFVPGLVHSGNGLCHCTFDFWISSW